MRIRRYIRRFREAGATAPEAAVTLEQLGIHETWTFRRMAARGVFIAVGQDRYWMDEPAAECYRNERRMRGLIILGIFLLLFMIIMLVNGSR